MSKTQMIVNYEPGEECRVAVTEDGKLEELQVEPADSVSFVGNIYKGKVMNVEPSIQAAFIDFGLETNGFLHVSDLHPQYFPGEDKETTELVGKKTPRRERPPIQQCLKKGQELIVQVLKEGINTKGPTLTSYLSIPGRSLVMLPGMDRVGVSRKVEDEDERRKMRKVLDQLKLPEGFGYILRTAGMGRSKTDLQRDVAYLQRLWKDIDRRRKQIKKPGILYAESDLLMRSLRDIWTSEVGEIIIDNEAALQRASRFMKIVAPRSSTKLLHYDKGEPIFHAFDIEEQIARIHSREVPLPSGGSLVIDETEAMIAIDVNSGRSRSSSNAESTAYKTNCEAVDEICRQLRLRDIGGLVLCDLIDMIHRSNRRLIETRFRDKLKRDRAASRALPISQFGIVEMTRQRVRGSMRSTHYTSCPMCSGRGVVRKPGPVATWAIREIAALLQHKKVGKLEIVVSSRVAGEFLSRRRRQLTRLEAETDKKIEVRISEDIAADRVVFYAYDESGADLNIEKLESPNPPRNLKEWVYDPKKDEEFPLDTLAGEPYYESLEHETDESEDEESPDDKRDSESRRAEGKSEDEDESRPKRRRRRRGGRRRRKGGADESSSDEPGKDALSDDDRREKREPARASHDKPEKIEKKSGPAPKADVASPRGDSWDLTPEELEEINKLRSTPIEPVEVTGEMPEDEEDERTPDETPKANKPEKASEKKDESGGTRGRSRRGTKKKPSGSRTKASYFEGAESESASGGSDEKDEAPASKKKRSGKKKKSTARKSPAKDEEEGSSDNSSKDGETSAPTSKKKTKARTKKKAARRPRKKSSAKKGEPSDSEGESKKAPETKSGETPKPKAKVRSLYATRRKLSDAELLKVQSRDE